MVATCFVLMGDKSSKLHPSFFSSCDEIGTELPGTAFPNSHWWPACMFQNSFPNIYSRERGHNSGLYRPSHPADHCSSSLPHWSNCRNHSRHDTEPLSSAAVPAVKEDPREGAAAFHLRDSCTSVVSDQRLQVSMVRCDL